MKTRTRLSDFQNDILWTTIFLGLAIWATVFINNQDPDDYFRWFGGLVLCVISYIVLFAKCIFVNQRLYKIYIFKEKIIEKRSNMEDTKYYFKLLRPFFFFPIWYSDWQYSIGSVERDIEKKKKWAKEEREKYFRREVIQIKRHDKKEKHIIS